MSCQLLRHLSVYNSRLLPRYCLLCADRSHARLDLCDGCAAELPWLLHPCSRCGIPLPAVGATLCGACLKRPPLFDACVAPLCYAAPVSQLISRFKYGSHRPAGHLLSQLLADHLVAIAAQLPDLLVPMPLHWRRRWQRGFNQAELISDVLARRLELPMHRALRRRRTTAPQQQLGAAERRRNLRGAFVSDGIVSGRRIALVDDVVTTGSTAESAARTLREAGARHVQIWCLARTPVA